MTKLTFITIEELKNRTTPTTLVSEIKKCRTRNRTVFENLQRYESDDDIINHLLHRNGKDGTEKLCPFSSKVDNLLKIISTLTYTKPDTENKQKELMDLWGEIRYPPQHIQDWLKQIEKRFKNIDPPKKATSNGSSRKYCKQ